MSLYVTHQLSDGDAEAFERHYFGCERCWNEVQRATEIRAALAGSTPAQKPSPQPSARVVRGPWTNWRLLAAAAAISLAAIAGGLLVLRQRPPTESSTATLVAAVGQRRLVEPRLVGFPYRPRDAATRGETSTRENDPQWRKLVAAAERVGNAAKERPSSEAARTAAVAHLLLGDFDEAVAGLENASRAYPRDARVWSDLSATFYSRGQSRRRANDLNGAIEDFEKSQASSEDAISLDHSVADAMFNRALATSALVDLGRRAPSEAADAWRHYLAVDGVSGWSHEANEYLTKTPTVPESELWQRERPNLDLAALRGDSASVSAIVGRFPQQARVYVEEEVLPVWATAATGEKAAASTESLRIATEIGQALSIGSGDRFVADAVAIVAAARRTGDRRLLSALATACQDYGRGRSAYRRREISQAVRWLRPAASGFHSAGSPLATAANLTLASCGFYQNDLRASWNLIRRIETDHSMERNRYPALFGQVYWLKGLIELQRGELSDALEAYEASLALLTRTNEIENIAAVEVLLAETYQYVGDSETSSLHRSRGLSLLNRLGPSERLRNSLAEAALAALEDGRPSVAGRYAEESLAVATFLHDPAILADAYLLQIRTFHAADQLSDAEAAVARARSFCVGIRDLGTRRRIGSLIDVAEASLKADRSPQRAVALLTSALSDFQRLGRHDWLAEIRLRRGRLYNRLAKPRLALADFRAGAAEVEHQRGTLSDELRVAYFDSARGLFDELVSVAARDQAPLTALGYVERARARSLLDEIAPGRSGRLRLSRGLPLNPLAVSSRLPASIALIEYYVLDDRLLTWVLRAGRVIMLRPGDSPKALSEVVARVRDNLVGEGDQEQFRKDAGDLYKALIAPAMPHLEHADTLIVVPDKFLVGVPFAALCDPTSGRYVVQDFSVTVAPSATVAVSLEIPGPLAAHSTALIIANPAIDRRRFPGLPELPGASAEGRRVGTYYAGSEILIGEFATKRRFAEGLLKHQIVHFAGHALVNTTKPALSALLFAKTAADSGILSLRELAALPLSHLRLVVLAGCRTGSGQERPLEGQLSLARALLVAGAPAILSSLSDIDDSSSARLLDLFHEAYRLTGEAPAALRVAQLAFLASPDRQLRLPSSWAPFEIVGGLPRI